MQERYAQELLRKGFLALPSSLTEGENEESQINAILYSFASFGYTLDTEGIKRLQELDEITLKQFYFEAINVIQWSRGANVEHTVFYKNFPHLEDMTPPEYFINAILHYLTAEADDYGYIPEKRPNENKPVPSNKEKRQLRLLDEDAALKLLEETVNAMLEGKTAVPDNRWSLIGDFGDEFPERIHPQEIPFHENLVVYAFIYSKSREPWGKVLNEKNTSFIHTITDWLRFYSAISCGKSDLKGKICLRSIDRRCRRLFLSIVERISLQNPYIYDELRRHEAFFKVAFEFLHPGEYAARYPNAYRVISDFRNDRYSTYYSHLEKAKDDQRKYLSMLAKRPGEFARALDATLRNPSYNKNLTIAKFREVAEKVSTPVLYSLYTFYLNRPEANKRYFIFASQDGFKTFPDGNPLPPMKQETKDIVISIVLDALRKIYSSYPRVEGVYLDPALKNYCLPSNSRNGNAQSKTLTYGSRVPLGKEDAYLRFFTHWKNTGPNARNRVDIDLSMELYNEKFEMVTDVSWHNMHGGKRIDAYHSGDMVTAPNGASEFVDVNLEIARKYGRYAIVCNVVYTGDFFADIPECFSGVALLTKEQRENGPIFDPASVELKFDLTSKGANSIISYAVDLETMELIWIDAPSIAMPGSCSSRLSRNIYRLCDALKTRINLYDFFLLHSGHLSFVEKKEDAKFIIGEEKEASLHPYDIETISSKWL